MASDLSTQIHGELHTSQLGTFSGGICGRILQTKKRLPLSTVQSELTNGGVRPHTADSAHRERQDARAFLSEHKQNIETQRWPVAIYSESNIWRRSDETPEHPGDVARAAEDHPIIECPRRYKANHVCLRAG